MRPHRRRHVAALLAPLAAALLPGAPEAAHAQPAPRARRAVAVVDLALSNTHACARLANGALRCWGLNRSGEVGDGTTEMRAAPVPVRGVARAAWLALGTERTCAQLADRTLLCWGLYDPVLFVTRGRAVPTPRTRPTLARPPGRIAQLAFGTHQSCARLADGTVTCWTPPAPTTGAVAPPAPAPAAPPTPVPVEGLTNVAEVTLGRAHSCARLTDATARCWGSNSLGELGDGTYRDQRAPQPVFGLTGIAQLVVAGSRTCARLADGTVRCWGLNNYGELGDGTTANRIEPTAVVGLSNVAEIALGESHACARLTDGTVRCWGANTAGQLGDGTRTNHSRATPVPGLAGVAQIALGGNTSCARLTDGTVRCWGGNGAGQVGGGAAGVTAQLTPVAVAF